MRYVAALKEVCLYGNVVATCKNEHWASLVAEALNFLAEAIDHADEAQEIIETIRGGGESI
jgi:hypothetical protein